MNTRVLTPDQVVAGYAAVARLYPHIPPLSLWRAWEHAAYRDYSLRAPVLDVGCGDGAFFRCLWGDVTPVTGIDSDPEIERRAASSGVYAETRCCDASALPFADAAFASAFANCSLEHMRGIDRVLAELGRCLAPGGELICSVVTDRFLAWELLPTLAAKLASPARAEELRRGYRDYQGVTNAWTPAGWQQALSAAGFEVLEHVPILPRRTSELFLLIDHLWHVPDDSSTGEVGGRLHAELTRIPNFAAGFGRILEGVLMLESEPTTCSGAVFRARRLGG